MHSFQHVQHDVRWLSVHDLQVDFQFGPVIAFSPNCFLFVRRSEHVGLGPGLPTADVDLEGRVRTVFKVLNRHFPECESALSWQSAKTPGGGSFGHPRQE